MRNRWGRLKVSRQWVIVVATVSIALALTFGWFLKAPVTIKILDLKQESLVGFQIYHTGGSTAFEPASKMELHWVGTFELRNNSSKEIEFTSYGLPHQIPRFECLRWENGRWVRDQGLTALIVAGGGGFSDVSLQPGRSIRFKATLYDRQKPTILALLIRTTPPESKLYELLPTSVLDRLPWLKGWLQVETEVIPNSAKEMPPASALKPNINE